MYGLVSKLKHSKLKNQEIEVQEIDKPNDLF